MLDAMSSVMLTAYEALTIRACAGSAGYKVRIIVSTALGIATSGDMREARGLLDRQSSVTAPTTQRKAADIVRR